MSVAIRTDCCSATERLWVERAESAAQLERPGLATLTLWLLGELTATEPAGHEALASCEEDRHVAVLRALRGRMRGGL